VSKGGARPRSGPPPDPEALRRERRTDGEWLTLPAAGRKGKSPAWPLSTASRRESILWNRLWKKPQALEWERLGQEIEVALYVRRLVEAEYHDSKVNLSTLVRQMGDSLGLTTPGMRANRWKVEVIKPAAAAGGRASARSSSGSSRARLKVVADDAVERPKLRR